MKKILTAVVFAAIVLTGCNKSDSLSDGENGMLRLSVSENNDLTVKSQDTTTDFSDYSVVFTKPSNSDYSLEYTYAEICESGTLELAPGKYTVTVTSPDTKNVAWDQPIYSGSSDFTIVTGAITEVSVLCTIQNMKVTVELTNAFINEFTGYNVVVSGTYDGKNEFLTFTPDIIAAGTAAWLNVTDPLKVYIKATRATTGDTMEQSGSITGTAAADHHIIYIDATGTGSAGITITISDDVNDKTTDITVPGFDETPAEDDPEDSSGDNTDDTGNTGEDTSDDSGDNTGDDSSDESSTAPSITWAANPTFADTYLAEEMDVDLVVNAPERIETFVVFVKSDALANTLNTLVGSTTLDLINDATTVNAMSALGLTTGNELKGQTSVKFSLSTLVPMILLYSPEAGSKHIFTLELTDSIGQSLSQTLTFVMPEEK